MLFVDDFQRLRYLAKLYHLDANRLHNPPLSGGWVTHFY